MMIYVGVIICIFSIFMSCFGIKLSPKKNVLIERNETIILKGVAILIVIISHYYRYTIHIGLEKIFVSSGYLGSSLFCLLSAYGCTKSYLNKGFTKEYFLLKIKHVYIPFVIVNIISLILLGGGYTLSDYILYTLGIKLVDGVLWYVPFIIGYYIIFWIVYKLFNSSRRRLGIIAMICIVYVLTCFFMNVKEQWYSSTLCIPLGCSVAEFERTLSQWSLKYSAKVFIISFVIFLLMVGTNLFFRNTEVIKSMTACLSSLLFSECIVIVASKIKLKENKLYLWIGTASYWIYLMHMKIFKLFYLDTAHLWVILFLLIVILLGICFNLTVEKIGTAVKKIISHYK